MSDTVHLFFRVLVDDLPAPLALDLSRVLGTVVALTDWRGVRFFHMPPPFTDLRIVDGEKLNRNKRRRLIAALEFFGQSVKLGETNGA